jgi:hypothetical protein
MWYHRNSPTLIIYQIVQLFPRWIDLFGQGGHGQRILCVCVFGSEISSFWISLCESGLLSSRSAQFELNCELQVVFDRSNGKLNESVIYDDAAIRPEFLIFIAT